MSVVFVDIIIFPFLLPLCLDQLCGVSLNLWGVLHYANRPITIGFRVRVAQVSEYALRLQ